MTDHSSDIATSGVDLHAHDRRLPSTADRSGAYRLPSAPVSVTCSTPACAASTSAADSMRTGWTLGPNTAICPDHRPRLSLPVAAA